MGTRSFTQFLKPNSRLLVTKGVNQGKVFESNTYPFVIGRDESADFQITGDNNISRRHAQISTNEQGSIWIEDLGSTNGSFVNNIRISGKTELEHGSTIIVGNTWLKFIIFTPVITDQDADSKIIENESSTFYFETKKVESILILDLYDSSRLANLYGDEVALAITEALNAITLPVFLKYRCTFQKGTGDGFLVTFTDPMVALDAAVEILERIKANNKSVQDSPPMHIRICLHHGQCSIEPNGDRHGNAVNIAFRVEGVLYRDMVKSKDSCSVKEFPDKDRIFVTQEFFQKLAATGQKRFRFIGNFRLKGISHHQPVHSLK